MKWAEHRENNIPIKYPNELRVLSIDGGGIKGIIPIIYLKRIEKQLGASIHNFFDMICGTSTGGIIALGLAAGISATEISEIYKKKVGEIPPQKLFRNNVFSSKYSNKSLLKLLKSTYADKKLQMQILCYAFQLLSTIRLNQRFIKTPHHKEYHFDGDRFMWEVALAASSAPLYFPAAEIGDAECKIDWGLWANNPLLVAIAEAKKLGFGLEETKIFSLGTGDSIYQVNNKVAKKSGMKD